MKYVRLFSALSIRQAITIIVLITVLVLGFGNTQFALAQGKTAATALIMQLLDQLDKRLKELENRLNQNVLALRREMPVSKERVSDPADKELMTSTISRVEVLEKSNPEKQISDIEIRLKMVESMMKDLQGSKKEAGAEPGLVPELEGLVKQLRITVDEAKQLKVEKAPEILTPEVVGFFNYSHDNSEGDGQSNSFEYTRVYAGMKYKLAKNMTARFRTDIGHQDKTGKFEVFAKYAYLEWKLNKKAKMVFGLQGTFNWNRPEKDWGYRVINYAPMEAFGKIWGSLKNGYKDLLHDRIDELEASHSDADHALASSLELQYDNFSTASAPKMGSSADLGVGLVLTPKDDYYIELMIRNGSGYKKAENDMFKNLQARTGGYFLEKRLHLSAYAEVEPWRGKDSDGSIKGYYNYQWELFGSYTIKDNFLVGVDANSKIMPGNFEDITAANYSVFGNVYLKPDKIKALARYDLYVSGFNNTDAYTGTGSFKSNANMTILGVDYIVNKHLHIIPNIQITTFEEENKDSDFTLFVHMLFKL